jgi:hypothetical protein
MDRHEIEAPRSKLRGMFCLTAVLRTDRKEVYRFLIRSVTPQLATGNALANAVQTLRNQLIKGLGAHEY